jgi:drug/metabolite transporter (DMT)-like permease
MMSWGDQRKGMLCAFVSSFIFAIRLCIIKVTPVVHTETLVFFRFFLDLLILSPFFIKKMHYLKTERVGYYGWRSLLVVCSIYCSSYGVRHLALGDAVLLQYTFPLFIALFLALFFKNRISWIANMGLLIGFSSLFFLLKPEWDVVQVASFFSLSSAVVTATLAISLQRVMKKEPIPTILFYCTLIPAIVSFFLYLPFWEPISWSVLALYLVPSSLLGVLYQFLIAKAYFWAPSHVVGGFSYCCVFFSAVLGWLIWGEVFEGTKLIGGILVAACSLLMVYETYVKMEKLKKMEEEV